MPSLFNISQYSRCGAEEYTSARPGIITEKAYILIKKNIIY
jgi:hypothetical protein